MSQERFLFCNRNPWYMKGRLYQYLLYFPQKRCNQITFICVVCWLLFTGLHLKYSFSTEIEFLVLFLISLVYNFFLFGKVLVMDVDAEPNPGIFRKMGRYLIVGLMFILIAGIPFCYGMVKYYEKQIAYYQSLIKKNQ